jgi:aromatic ring-opening dioxygenase LigB subunit
MRIVVRRSKLTNMLCLALSEHDAAAQLYDQAVEFWLRTLRSEGLLITARKAVALAQPCAYHMLVLLCGVLDGKV